MSATSSGPAIRRADAEPLSKALFDRMPRWKPGIWTFRDGERELLVKDVRRAAPLFRFTLGRWSLRREGKIYRRLAGVPRIPAYLGALDRDALLFEKVDAEPLRRDRAQKISPDFFRELEDWIRGLHARGIVHLDLRQKRNILVGSDGKPWIVDFGAALCLGANALSRAILLPLFAWIDFSAIAKFRVRYRPELASEEERKRVRRMHFLRRFWIFSPHKNR